MKKLVSRNSKIHGFGLFAAEKIKSGEFVAHIRGQVSTVKKDLLYTPQEAKMHPNWVGITMTHWVDPNIPFKYLNHSCDPSCGVKGKIRMYALKNMEIGDEITVDYSTIEANPFWHMRCSCGSSKCRREIKSVSFLPKDVFDGYIPFIPTAFKKFYQSRRFKKAQK